MARVWYGHRTRGGPCAPHTRVHAIHFTLVQGFTKTVSLPKDRHSGYIKEYDGGQCTASHTVQERVGSTRCTHRLAVVCVGVGVVVCQAR